MIRKNNPIRWITIIFILVVILSIINLSIGAVLISPKDIILSFLGNDIRGNSLILENYRIPRTILAILIGSSLAVSGTIFQGILGNPLASPDVIGITKGSGLAAAIILVLFPKSSVMALPIAAFIGAALIAMLIYIFSFMQGARPTVIALVGVALGAICNAAIQYLMVKNTMGINVALVWLSGSLWGRSMTEVYMLLPWTMILLPVAFFSSNKLDILSFGDDIATSLGENVKVLRILLLVLAVALTGSSVAIAGTIGFVGLIAPHMARQIVGTKHKLLIPTSAILGAILILISDSIGKGLFIPIEIPTGIVTSIIGAPYFLYLLVKNKQ
ncbi:FecCD family ABC transporter permease [Clostridium saccharobutylicum]|uniref:Putative siderophore transport system permease protein YfhA n=1 Tax=Clostridium saccharobutylicum TaxID=169679 RepID=A0A1S8N1I8_CLOSA|nr:iron chelate uptake ABC transporter family permease subunit [Clostridium saccharobutylicum]OOM10379.1 putative siderophore transport system permease protein YfhA [Clostridium saccharobutylicum]